MSREFGIHPETYSPRQWWGARAIIDKGKLDILPDRQNYEKDETVADDEKSDFFDWMSTTMDAALRKAVAEGKFHVWEDYFILESKDGRFHCEATSKNSGGGYLYIGVWQL